MYVFVDENMNAARDHANASVKVRSSKQHQCTICTQGFRRAEHLARHVRAHLHQRPFECRYCPKSFARKDLLTRHEKTIHAAVYSQRPTQPKRKENRPGGIASNNEPSPPLSDESERNSYASDVASDMIRNQITGCSDVQRPDDVPQSDASLSPAAVIAGEVSQFDATISPSHGDGQVDILEQTDAPTIPVAITQSSAYGLNAFTMLENTLFGDLDLTSIANPLFQSPQFHYSGPDTGDFLDADQNIFNELPDNLQFGNGPFITDASMSLPIADGNQPRSSSHHYIDAAGRDSILCDLKQNHDVRDDELSKISPAHMLDSFVSKYFTAFHRHLPIIHPPTFKPVETPGPLLLAICSIGALYSLNTKHAAILQSITGNIVAIRRPRNYTSEKVEKHSLWMAQCRLLLLWSTIFGGNTRTASDGISDAGSIVCASSLLRSMLSSSSGDHLNSWHEWVHRETTKRTLCGLYILSSLICSVFDIPPHFSGMRDLDFEMPAGGNLWDAENKDEWLWRKTTQPSGRQPGSVAAEVQSLIFNRDFEYGDEVCLNIGPFAATTLMHGVNVHMYFLAQTMSVPMLTQNTSEEVSARSLFREREIENTIRRSQSFLRAWRLAHHESDQQAQEQSTIFNCQSILRLSYAKASGISRFCHLSLIFEDKSAITDALASYVTAPQQRNAFLTRAAEQVMYCFTTPIKAGHMFTRKTAAFTWSVEHAVACWECNLFLGKWIHTTELSAQAEPLNRQEQSIFDTLKDALLEADKPFHDQESLASQVTRQWALFMDDVWVWEVTARMGPILRELADLYTQGK